MGGVRSRLSVGLLVLGTSWLSVAACSEDSGGDGSSQPVPDASSDGQAGQAGQDAQSSTTPCLECFQTTCAKEVEACKGDNECSAYFTCLHACPPDAVGNAEQSCVDACPAATTSTGTETIRKLEACRIYAVDLACSDCNAKSSPHPILNQECAPSGSSDACQACLQGHCCKTSAAFNANPATWDIVDCVDACSPTTALAPCLQSCFEQHPTGVSDYISDFACFDLYCQSDCGFPHPYSPTCSACFQGPCAETKLACDTDPDCFLINTCAADCALAPNCVKQCAEGKPDKAYQRFEAQFVCVAQLCGDGACSQS